MPAPLARGIIITVTVLVAASLAAYENPQVRAWIDRTRHKIAMGLHSLGDEIGPEPRPRPRRTSTDISMHEAKGELADERRRQAIAEIMERGRLLEERRKKSKISEEESNLPLPSFNSIVDGDGVLLQDQEVHQGQASGSDAVMQDSTIRHRSVPTAHQVQESQQDPFESRYEQEMREAWNLPVSERRIDIGPSHAPESLIELTPTTEGVPDPDFSIPSAGHSNSFQNGSEYFPMQASNSTHTLSDTQSYTCLPPQREPQPHLRRDLAAQTSASLARSISESVSDIHSSEVGESSDDVLSDGDGIRTPGSTWTDVDSTVSGDFHL